MVGGGAVQSVGEGGFEQTVATCKTNFRCPIEDVSEVQYRTSFVRLRG